MADITKIEPYGSRVVACINALAGVPTEALTGGAVARLVEVARKTLEVMIANGDPFSGDDQQAVQDLRAALAPWAKEPPHE